MKFYKTEEILGELERCIEYKIPFSHLRFGDGGIKFLHSVLTNDKEQLNIIIKKEGLPPHKIIEVFELWGYYARHANFIDSPEIYFTGKFWPRIKKAGKPINSETELKMRDWYKLYDDSEFDNENYCNPESNYLMILRIAENKKNLLNIMKNKKICIITVFPDIVQPLEDYNVDIIKIAGHWQNQYENSFKQVIELIKNSAKSYDLWLVAAGELGRIYTGMIKENGGRAVDIGFVIEFWLGQDVHPRLSYFMNRSETNSLELELTEEGMKYIDSI